MPGTRSRGSRLALICAGAFAAAMALAPPAGAVTASYDFTGSTQRWQAAQSSAGPFAVPSYNPSGFIFAEDTGDDSGCNDGGGPCDYFFWASPPLVTTLTNNYGGSIAFDYSTNVYSPGAVGVLYIDSTNSSGAELGYVFSIPGPGFQRITVPLTEAGWRYCTDAPRTCTPATRDQFQTGLMAGVYTDILADTIVGTGETYALDNFTISEKPVPAKPGKKCKPKRGKGKKRKCKKKKKKGKKRALGARPAALPHLGRP